MTKTALITGVSGQDGAYLSKFLLERGYRVLGQVPCGSPPRTARLSELGISQDVEIVAIDLFDVEAMRRELTRFHPDEVYNLAGPSSVAFSFQRPTEPLEVNAVAAARLLEAVRLAAPDVHLFQPSTSEMFGSSGASPQNEATPFRPRSPYAAAKLFSHWQTVIYREAYGLFGVCGIMFNHESPLRSRQFVTRKITAGLAEIKHGRRDRLMLGNLEARRDWGFAGDYVEGMWCAVRHREPGDYVFATGTSTSVRRFVELAAGYLGMRLDWSGSDAAEVGIDHESGRTVIAIDPALYRPAELRETVGDARHARDVLKWSPSTKLEAIVGMMAEADEKRVIENRSLD